MTSQLAAGESAAVSYASAAWLLGIIERRPDRIDVTIRHNAHHGVGNGFLLHRARSFECCDTRVAKGIRVTCPARTLVDLASVLPARALAAVLDAALLRGLVTIGVVRRYIRDRRLGRNRGVGTLVRLLDDREFGVPESELEREFLALVDACDLQKPARQQALGAHRVDFAYPSARLLIEVDGRATHGTAAAFEADPVRQNDLVLDGWRVLRFTWAQVTQRRKYVAETVRHALRQDPEAEGPPDMEVETGTRSATVKARTVTEVLELDGATFRDLVRSSPDMG
jgi:very-short-patch-repair endonuclease